MILLPSGNRILEEACSAPLKAKHDGKHETMDVRLCDFDDVTYRVQVPAKSHTLLVSMNCPCYDQIEKEGSEDAVKAAFGDYLQADAETGFTLTLKIDLTVEREAKDIDELIHKLSHFKTITIGGIYEKFFTALAEEKSKDLKPCKFDLRGDTTVYFCPRDYRVITIYSIDFSEHADKVIAKIFLQEFVDSKRKQGMGQAPPISWSETPPRELEEFGITENKGSVLGYLSFAVMPNHAKKTKEISIETLQTFRNYLQYHIKCSKSYFHERMRHRVKELLKVLNRAKMSADEKGIKKEKKTASGRTFKR